MKKGYKINIETATVNNNDYRKVLYTSTHSQLVLMSLLPGQEIGSEIHEENDQFFRFETGQGRVIINDTVHTVCDGDAVIVPAGARHNVINDSKTESLKLYTIYSPAHHKDGISRKTKEEAEKDGLEFDGITTE